MQTDYSIDMSAAKVGMLADSALVQDIVSYKNPDAEVKFGCLVTHGAADGEVVHPDAAAEVTDEKLVRGVVVATHELESVENSEDPGYAAGSVVPVLRKGRIWVESEDAVTQSTSGVYARVLASSPLVQLGAFRASSMTSYAAAVPKAKWRSSTTGAAQLAVLEIDL